MKNIDSFSNFRKKYLNNSILENSGDTQSVPNTPAGQIYHDLNDAASGAGTKSRDLFKVAQKYNSLAIFKEVEDLMKENPIGIYPGYKSLQELLNGECSRGDLDVVAAFAGALNKIPELGFTFEVNERGSFGTDFWRNWTSVFRRSGYQGTFKTDSIRIVVLDSAGQAKKQEGMKAGTGCTTQQVDNIYNGLKKGSEWTFSSGGTDEGELQKTASFYISLDCYNQVEAKMKTDPIDGHNSLQALLNSELGWDDLDVLTSFETQFDKIGVKIEYQTKKGVSGYASRLVENSIKITPTNTQTPTNTPPPNNTSSENAGNVKSGGGGIDGGGKTDDKKTDDKKPDDKKTDDKKPDDKKTDDKKPDDKKTDDKKTDDKKTDKKDGISLFESNNPQDIDKRIIELITEGKLIIDRTSEKAPDKDVKEIEIIYKSSKSNEKSQEILVNYLSQTGYNPKTDIKEQISKVEGEDNVTITFSRKEGENFFDRVEYNSLRVFLYFYYKGDLSDRILSKSWVIRGDKLSDQDEELLTTIINAISWRGEIINKSGSKEERKENRKERRQERRQERKRERQENRERRKKERSSEQEQDDESKESEKGSGGHKYESYVIKDFEYFKRK